VHGFLAAKVRPRVLALAAAVAIPATLASALLANDVHLVGRSFKYHRPRGILSAGAEEPNALVTVDRGPGRLTPNLRATQIELYDGLIARSQNRYPSLRFDLGALAIPLPRREPCCACASQPPPRR